MTPSDSRRQDDADAQVARLMREDDASFLRGAYQLTLGRGIDRDGHAFYTQRLAAGAKRIEVVWELASSDESQAYLAERTGVFEAIARAAGRKMARPESVAELLRLSDAAFIDASTKLLHPQGTPDVTRSRLLARLAGGVPRYRILQELAASTGRSSFPRIAGLDALLASARDGLFPVAASVGEIFAYEDEAFVDCAYKTLMGRAPDAAGGRDYLERLRSGWSRSWLIESLARSSEARMRRAALEGLRSLSWRYRMANLSGLAGLVAPLLRTEADTAPARARRMLRSLAMRLSAIEAGAGTTAPRTGERAASASSDLSLMARHEAMLDIQRDSFEREMNALRKRVVRLLEKAAATRDSMPAASARQRRRPRQ